MSLMEHTACACVSLKEKMTNLIDKISKFASMFEKKAQDALGMTVGLEGPFSQANRDRYSDETIEVDDVELGFRVKGPRVISDRPTAAGGALDGDAFWLEVMDTFGEEPENWEEYSDSTSHSFAFEADWHYEPEDPEVGISGGWELEDFNLVSFDGLNIENKKDKEKLESALTDYIFDNQGKWLKDHLEGLADDKGQRLYEEREEARNRLLD